MAPSICAITLIVTIPFVPQETGSPSSVPAEAADVENAATPRQLYESAAKSIAQGQPGEALAPLQQLVSEYPESELVPTAALHLAECLLLVADYDLARQQLLDLQAQKLPAAYMERVEKLLIILHQRAAQEALQSGDYSRALRWMTDATTHELTPAQQQYFRREIVKAGRAGCIQQLEATGSCEDFLKPISIQHQVPIRFALAELLAARGDVSRALGVLDALSSSLAGQHPTVAMVATIELRRGEMLVQTRNYAQARPVLQQALTRHTDFARWYEYDFLLARAAIARADFDHALRRLQDVLQADENRPTVPAADQARAQWTVGEVHFLQKQYSEAIEAYALVSQYDAAEWQVRATLQTAKCLELLGQPTAARDHYQQVLELSKDSSESQFAARRLAQLQTSSSPSIIR